MSTTFKVITTEDKDGGSSLNITDPILASFPCNTPTAKALSKMHFNVSQLDVNKKKEKTVKRVVKAEYKGISYKAESSSLDKNLASDYYLTLLDTSDNKAYAIKVDSAFQFTQVIERFQEELQAARDGFPEPLDNEAIKQMSYMEKKKELAQAFGTKKAIKQVTSMMTNQVDENGITNKPNKGIRDNRLIQRASEIADEQEALKKQALSLVDQRHHSYQRDNLLPPKIMNDLPYKETLSALKSKNDEELTKLFNSAQVKYMLKDFYYGKFDLIESKHEKKFALRAFILLDCLVAMYRFNNHIEISPEVLAVKFKTQQHVVDWMLSTFTDVSINTNQNPRFGQEDERKVMYKYIKNKDNTNNLILYIIGIMALLVREFRGSLLVKIIKRDFNDLKGHLRSLGIHHDPVKKEGEDDDNICKAKGQGSIAFKHQEPVATDDFENTSTGSHNKRRKTSSHQ